MNYSEYKAEFKRLGLLSRMIGFQIGDLILDAEEHIGTKTYQAMLETGLADSTLMDFSRVADRWPEGTRREKLGFAYHRDAGSDMEIAERLLRAAEDNGWSREQLRKAKKQLEEVVD